MKEKDIKTIALKITKRKRRLKVKVNPTVQCNQKLLFPHKPQPDTDLGWTEIIPECDPIKFFKKLKVIIEKRGADLKGRFHLTVRVNGGYKSNHETGLTVDVHYTGKLIETYKQISALGVNEPLSDIKELNELVNKYCD
jgi:hypothetical protein